MPNDSFMNLNFVQKLIRWYCYKTPEHRGKARLKKMVFNRLIEANLDLNVALYPYKQLKIKIKTKEEIGKGILLSGLYEKNYALTFCKLVQPGDIVLDIGANSGQYTLLASWITGSEGFVYAFEPAPHKFNELLSNIKSNKLNNIKSFNYALSNYEGFAYLNLQKNINNDGMHYLTKNTSYQNKHSIKVVTHTLDYVIQSIINKPIDLIKIDIEGWEEQVFQKSNLLFSQNKPPTIFFEWIPQHVSKAGLNTEGLFNFLKSLNYKIFAMDEKQKNWFEISNSNLYGSNFIAIHQNRPNIIKKLMKVK